MLTRKVTESMEVCESVIWGAQFEILKKQNFEKTGVGEVLSLSDCTYRQQSDYHYSLTTLSEKTWR